MIRLTQIAAVMTCVGIVAFACIVLAGVAYVAKLVLP